MTVFTIPPHHVTFEVGEELLRCLKDVSIFLRVEMAMVALSCFIVVAYDAYTAYDVASLYLNEWGDPATGFGIFHITSSANAVSENAMCVRRSATAFMPNDVSDY